VAQISLVAQPRDPSVHANQLRQQGWVPAVMYGHNIPAESVQIERISLDKAVKQGALTHLTTLDFGARQVAVLIKELQRHPVKRNPLHVDFYQVSMTELVEIDVRVKLLGALPASVGSDYVLVHNLETITVSCLPGNIPDSLAIDISQLTPEHYILHARDLVVPANVKLAIDPDEAVVMLSRTRAAVSEETDEAAPATTSAEPEVVVKGKAAKGEELPEETKKK